MTNGEIYNKWLWEDDGNNTAFDLMEAVRADERIMGKVRAEMNIKHRIINDLSEYAMECYYDGKKAQLDEDDEYLRELSDIKSGCSDWLEEHDEQIRADERKKVLDEFEQFYISCDARKCGNCNDDSEYACLKCMMKKFKEQK